VIAGAGPTGPGGGVRFLLILRPMATTHSTVGGTVLVVDDDRRITQMLALVLEGEGYLVQTAGNGEEALAQLAGAAFDVVITDVRMPRMDGPALYRELRARHPGLLHRLIFITGDDMNPDTRRFLAGVTAPALHKPFDMEEFLRLVHLARERTS
jgi:CheY-like chemotaxis protein